MQARNISFVTESYGEASLYGNSWALVAGVNDYESLDPLHFAVADAEAVAQLLPNLGFSNVCLLRDKEVTKNNISLHLDEMKAHMGPNDRLLIHFSGHGVPVLTNGKKHGYLLLHNSKIEGELPVGPDACLDNVPNNAYNMRAFREEVDALRAKHKLIILDACFSGFMLQPRNPANRLNSPELRGCVADPVTEIFAAGRYRDLAWEDDQYSHGVFTHHLLKGLRGGADPARRGWFTLDQLASYVRNGVATLGRQMPIWGRWGDGQGHFVFVWDRAATNAKVLEPPVEQPRGPLETRLISRRDEFAYASRLASVDSSEDDERATSGHSGYTPASRENAKDGQIYVWVPAGDFLMGAVPDDVNAGPEEKPQRRVRISKPFWISQTPVTVDTYRRFWPGAPQLSRKVIPSRLPITGVTWEEASRFCERSGGRLPTEAEWEYAARGGVEGFIFPWGNRIRRTKKHLREVGQPSGNGFALMDVCGYVREWCADFFDQTYYRSRPDLDLDPTGPANGQRRVIRGGAFSSDTIAHRLSAREGRVSRPVESFDDVGFRCVIPEEDFCPA